MKVAIAHWQGRVSPVFDVADNLLLLTVENGGEILRENLRLIRRGPFGRAQELAALGVDVLLCGAVSLTLEKALISAGIEVIAFLGGELQYVIRAYLDGNLTDGRVRSPSRISKRTGFRSEKTKRASSHHPGLRR